MKINGSSKIGIWKYTDDAKYEPGDFIIIGRKIFYCERESKGNNPETSDNYFTPYPGNMIKNKEEYYEIAKNLENAEDKYISSKVLSEILQDSFFGLGNDGIIESKVDVSGSEEIATGFSSRLSGTGSAVDEIMTSPELNNGVVLLSRNLPEIKPYIGVYAENQEDGKSCIYCDRNRCVKCWNCIKINKAERIRKTKFDDLVINNSGAHPSDWTDSISECPAAALIRAYPDDVKVEEEQVLWNSAQLAPEKAESDIIIYGAETWGLPYVKPNIDTDPIDTTSTKEEDYFLAIDKNAEIDFTKFNAQGIWQYFKDMAVEILPEASEDEREKLFSTEAFSLYEISKNIRSIIEEKSDIPVEPDRSMDNEDTIERQWETIDLTPNGEYIPIIQDKDYSLAKTYINNLKDNNIILSRVKEYLSNNFGIPSESISVISRQTKTKYKGTRDSVNLTYERLNGVRDTLEYVEDIWQYAQNSNLLTPEEKKNIIQVSNDSVFFTRDEASSNQYAGSWAYELLYNYIVFDNVCPIWDKALSKYNIGAGFSLSWGDAIDNWTYPSGVSGGTTRRDKIAYISTRNSDDSKEIATKKITWIYITRHFLTASSHPMPDSFIVNLPTGSSLSLEVHPLFYENEYRNEVFNDQVGVKFVRGSSETSDCFERLRNFDVNTYFNNYSPEYDDYRFKVRQILWLSNLIDCIKIDSSICNKLYPDEGSNGILNTLINEKSAYATKRIDLNTYREGPFWYDISNFSVDSVDDRTNRTILTSDQMFSYLREKFMQPLAKVPSLYGQRDLIENNLKKYSTSPEYIVKGLTTNEWLDLLKNISKEKMDSAEYSFIKTSDSITFDNGSIDQENIQSIINEQYGGISLNDLLDDYNDSTGIRSISKLDNSVYNAALYTVSLKPTSVIGNTIYGELILLKEVARRKVECMYASALMWSGKHWYDRVFSGEDQSLISNDVTYEPEYSAVSIINPSNYVLLRQYTYKQKGESGNQQTIYRIQELVDPDYGYIWFRTSSSTDDGRQFTSVSDWKEVAAGMVDINKKLSDLVNYAYKSSSINKEYYYRSVYPLQQSSSIVYPGVFTVQSNFANVIVKDLGSNRLYSCIIDINEIHQSGTVAFYVNDDISVEGSLEENIIIIRAKYQGEEDTSKVVIKELQYRVYNN